VSRIMACIADHIWKMIKTSIYHLNGTLTNESLIKVTSLGFG
jgi:hypothetical protein